MAKKDQHKAGLRPLRISAFSALNCYFNAESAEIRREPQRKSQ